MELSESGALFLKSKHVTRQGNSATHLYSVFRKIITSFINQFERAYFCIAILYTSIIMRCFGVANVPINYLLSGCLMNFLSTSDYISLL